MPGLTGVRGLFVFLVATAAWLLPPFGLSRELSAALGVALAALGIFAELRLREVTIQRLIGAAAGSLLGIFGAFLISLVLDRAIPQAPLIPVFILLMMTYCGVAIGVAKGDALDLRVFGGLFGIESTSSGFLIIDTSVIIDGRIADVAATGFLEGVLVIPTFVLRELQQVADSPDALRRNRGRRGLDLVKHLQTLPNLEVRFSEEDFPLVKEVDHKLIELAKVTGSKIVTNDFNLNKLAGLHGVAVLNINELANSLKPVVLPGEVMRVFILKEGKEANQGVAYLDDGTMVVVDNARRCISKNIDITVTSVLQTTAGKMIFGKFDERAMAREA